MDQKHCQPHVLLVCSAVTCHPITPGSRGHLSRTSTDTCRLWNANSCRFPQCKYRHACSLCGDPHPAVTCPQAATQNEGKTRSTCQSTLYWCAVSSDGDGDVMVAKWASITNHIQNIHIGHDNALFPKCGHKQLTGRDREKKWIKPGMNATPIQLHGDIIGCNKKTTSKPTIA